MGDSGFCHFLGDFGEAIWAGGDCVTAFFARGGFGPFFFAGSFLSSSFSTFVSPADVFAAPCFFFRCGMTKYFEVFSGTGSLAVFRVRGILHSTYKEHCLTNQWPRVEAT